MQDGDVALQLIECATERAGIGPARARSVSRIRERELEAGRLVQRAIRATAGDPGAGVKSFDPGTAGLTFLVRRASTAVDDMEKSAARAALTRAVNALNSSHADAECADAMVHAATRMTELKQSMTCYGGVLERFCLWPAAGEAYATALAVAPTDPELMLHLARTYRLRGGRTEALALYGKVREQSGTARLARFAELGEALVSADPVAALTAVLVPAMAAGESELCAVALEERARLHRSAGRIDDAVADYLDAGGQYSGAQDRVRIAHTLSDLMLARGDVDGAREALHAALDIVTPAQRPHVVHRLRAVARAQGDEVGLRLWPPSTPAALVSLIGPRRPLVTDPSRAPLLREWRNSMSAS